MWFPSSVFYQINPIGFCGAPRQNDGQLVNRITRVIEWTDYFLDLGVNVIMFNPIFQSASHGYNTLDYYNVDVRLGTNDDFKAVCDHLHSKGIRVVLDGVFNHVDRGFFAFEDVRQNKQESRYRDWFFIDWDGDNNFNDGFSYQAWEGNLDLVELNLENPELVEHLLSAVLMWFKTFNIDGLRIDVAYKINKDFLYKLHSFCRSLRDDFHLLGEMISGDYSEIMNVVMMDSVTNYEGYNAIYTSFNEDGLAKVVNTMNRQFGTDEWSQYTGFRFQNFVDNHDVTRIASLLTNPAYLPFAYALLFAMPGVPCIYYGSEWGAQGHKDEYDDALRPYFEAPVYNELRDVVKGLISFWRNNGTMQQITYKPIFTNDYQMVIERSTEFETIWFVMNIYNESFKPGLTVDASRAVNLFSNKEIPLVPELELPAKCFGFIKL